MPNIIVMKARLVAVALTSSLLALSANAVTYSFTQNFQSGGVLSGSFTGEDSGNGFLEYDSFSALPELSELSAFSLSYSGGGGVPAFSMGLGELLEFSFRLGGDLTVGNDSGGELGGEGISAYLWAPGVGDWFYATGELQFLNPGGTLDFANSGFTVFESDSADENPLAVEQVPDSGSTALLGLPLALALFASRIVRKGRGECRD